MIITKQDKKEIDKFNKFLEDKIKLSAKTYWLKWSNYMSFTDEEFIKILSKLQ
jgi:hypothetical protein